MGDLDAPFLGVHRQPDSLDNEEVAATLEKKQRDMDKKKDAFSDLTHTIGSESSRAICMDISDENVQDSYEEERKKRPNDLEMMIRPTTRTIVTR